MNGDTYVAEFGPTRLYGPFDSREEAEQWASAHARTFPDDEIVEWSVGPLHNPEGEN